MSNCYWLSFLAYKIGFAVGVDGTNWAVVNEEIGSCGTGWEALEVEKKSPPVAGSIQMEVAEAMETFRMD